jgi:polysaccharide biosynthesis protein PslJ
VKGLGTRLRLDWRWLVVVIVLVVLFIPIRRYKIALGLPFQLEPYRLVLLVLLGVWVLSLLGDPRESVRKTGLGRPLRLYFVAIAGSILLNPSIVREDSGSVAKLIFVLLGFLALFLFVASVVRSLRAADTVIAVLVAGGVVVAVLAVIESRFGWSPFTNLQRIFPFLAPILSDTLARGSNLRAMGPAEHPIALAALLVMILPFSLYLALKRRKRFYWVGVVLLAVGSTSSVSRTSVLMLGVIAVSFIAVKPRETVRFAPLIVPFLVVVHFATPGTLGTLKASFFGETLSNQGRTEDYGPAFQEIGRDPVFGRGFGTRITTGPEANAEILDNQWLASLIETGVVGIIALAWLLGSFVRRVGGAARQSADSPESWLLLGLASSVAAFAIGMFLYDAFSFIQVTMVLFILLGLGSALVTGEDAILAPAPRPHEAGAHASVAGLAGRLGPLGRRASGAGRQTT